MSNIKRKVNGKIWLKLNNYRTPETCANCNHVMVTDDGMLVCHHPELRGSCPPKVSIMHVCDRYNDDKFKLLRTEN